MFNFDLQALWDSLQQRIYDGLNDFLTRVQNFGWSTLEAVVVNLALSMPVPNSLVRLENNMPIAIQMYRHGLTWMWLFSYFINLRLLFGAVGLVLLLEAALVVPRVWIFIKRMIPFI